MTPAEEIVARARALIGIRFRPQGRSPELGLDCIGVAAMATGAAADEVPRHYDLTSTDLGEVNDDFSAFGLLRLKPGKARAGDLLLTRIGRRLHVVILTPEGYLHADARLRCAAEVPGGVPWPIVSAWRHPDVAPRHDGWAG